jgi:type II secretory pathway component GspD/PulD (secretin)
MKTHASMALVLALGVLAGPRTWSAEPGMLEPRMINFRGADVRQVLDVYKTLVQVEFIMDSRVKKLQARITARNERAISERQAAELIEKALLEQAGIVISGLDAKRASVTYNDALPIVPNAGGETPITRDAPSTEPLRLPMRHFRVDTNSFFSNLRTRMKADNHQLEAKLLKDYFGQQGVDVSPPFETLYQPATGNLLVRPRKEEDWEKIERLMAGLQSGK